uniref:dolichol kinase n=1 Tax=Nelumbo nucifera TaxID=4432 RepID=A0A822Y5B5_NELNU|nr:TPA_asm: hypothetical protein HUJ06_028259 [Nelumbo nucifera]
MHLQIIATQIFLLSGKEPLPLIIQSVLDIRLQDFFSSSFLILFILFSHFSLLLGCALPKWISTGFNDRPLAPLAGILSLGIGDTMVSDILLLVLVYPLLRCIFIHE